LADVEKVDQTFELVFRKLWAEHEAFYGEAIQEELYSIGLHNIICIDQSLSL